MSRRRTITLIAAMAFAATLAGGADTPAPGTGVPPATPPKSGLVEQTGVELFLLDIEVRDRSGRPMRGLTAADFVVRRNGRLWPVVSVDDFCSCDPEAPPATPAAAGGAPAGPGLPAETAAPAPPAAPADSAPPAIERPLVVIYFDFGQMRSDGRDLAVKTARRWVETVKAPDERVMVAGYVTSRGVLTLAEPTTDPARLRTALDDAATNVAYSDVYALQLPDRLDECLRRDPSTCPTHAITEYDHGRRSVEALQLFMAHLGMRPGPKSVLYFHENGLMETGRIYKQSDRRTNYQRVEQVGAEATAAHATVYPLVVSMAPIFGAFEDQSVGFNATLAESTGGSYNRGALDLDGVVAAATRGCRCRYVLGFKPIDAGSHAIAAVSVVARGVKQSAFYRVRSSSAEDRFLRQASAVLEDPGSARDLPIAAAIRVLRAGGRRWDLATDVAVDARVLTLLPRGAASEGGWEVGARLQRLDTNAVWEMLAMSQATTSTTGAPDAVLLHTHTFTGLAPGRYRLSAFMRDKVANVFGGGEAILELPDPAKGGVAGPVMLIARAPRRVSPLPLLGDRAQPKDVPATADTGPAPATSLRVPRGTLLRFESFLCGAPGRPPAEAVASLTRDEATVLRLDDRVATPAGGGCVTRVDDLVTSALEPGSYLYLLHARTGATPEEPIPVAFVIVPGDAAP